MNIAFIHIGKTGGTTIDRLLREKLTNYKEYHHNNMYTTNEKYIIWIRNPVARFVSAFNHSYYGVHTDARTIQKFDLNHTLIPDRMRNSIGKPYVFSKEYDTLMKQFTSANHLAESLTSTDTNVQRTAIELMNRSEEHISKGIHWYLHKDNFLQTNRKNILFVGKTESMKEDILHLSSILGIQLNETLKLRENIYLDKSMKYMSPIAIQNIIEWYKDTDYAILKEFATEGLIHKSVFHMYHMRKNIFILWFQGFENAPEVVQRCANSWKHYNPDWNVILLDDTNLRKYIQLDTYIPDIQQKNINKTALSDIVRIVLLKKYGGLWVDATTFCNTPLNDWLPNCIQEGFFAFHKPGPDRLLSTWLLYANTDNYIIDKWLLSVIHYYTIHDTPHTYFWVHYLFGDIYTSDLTFQTIWKKVPKWSPNGSGPHCILESMFHTITNEIQHNIDTKIAPLYKLTYKCTFPEYDETKIVYYLYSTIRPTQLTAERST